MKSRGVAGCDPAGREKWKQSSVHGERSIQKESERAHPYSPLACLAILACSWSSGLPRPFSTAPWLVLIGATSRCLGLDPFDDDPRERAGCGDGWA